MNIEVILRYATLLWLLLGGVSVLVAFIIHREQVKTQIFLALSARYDDWMQTCATAFWSSTLAETTPPNRSNDLTISALRLCVLVSLAYYLFREHHIPKRMWELFLRAAERRMRTPLFAREWEHIRCEFEAFPEFVALVTSVQRGVFEVKQTAIH
jgi:hypothetical protein